MSSHSMKNQENHSGGNGGKFLRGTRHVVPCTKMLDLVSQVLGSKHTSHYFLRKLAHSLTTSQSKGNLFGSGQLAICQRQFKNFGATFKNAIVFYLMIPRDLFSLQVSYTLTNLNFSRALNHSLG